MDGVHTETVTQGKNVTIYSPFKLPIDPLVARHLILIRCQQLNYGWKVFELPSVATQGPPLEINLPLEQAEALPSLVGHSDEAAIEAVLATIIKD